MNYKIPNYYTYIHNHFRLPDLFAVMLESVRLWTGIADLTTPILKLIVEFTMNRQSRLTYDMHTCTSVILFREVSKVICEYGMFFVIIQILQANTANSSRESEALITNQIMQVG